jgi:hypothetical protein
MRTFTNTVATLSLRKLMSSEVVVAPLAFVGVMLVYLSASCGFSA